ncbi:MAG: hypothetical protein RL095_2882 [Verrucomicrobiota bacterium]|jgi:hypothetical protein
MRRHWLLHGLSLALIACLLHSRELGFGLGPKPSSSSASTPADSFAPPMPNPHSSQALPSSGDACDRYFYKDEVEEAQQIVDRLRRQQYLVAKLRHMPPDAFERSQRLILATELLAQQIASPGDAYSWLSSFEADEIGSLTSAAQNADPTSAAVLKQMIPLVEELRQLYQSHPLPEQWYYSGVVESLPVASEAEISDALCEVMWSHDRRLKAGIGADSALATFAWQEAFDKLMTQADALPPLKPKRDAFLRGETERSASQLFEQMRKYMEVGVQNRQQEASR